MNRRSEEMARKNVFYDFGIWGYYQNDTEGQIMPGFAAEPPGIEIIGNYEILYVAALRYNAAIATSDIFLRRTTTGTVSLEAYTDYSNQPFPIRIRDPQPTNRIAARTARRTIFSTPVFTGIINMDVRSHGINRYFGPGYNIHGFDANSEASQAYNHKPSNSCLVVTHRNNNLGRLYVVSERKAFRMVERETGILSEPDRRYESQEEETLEAERICTTRHLSVLCRGLGFPCNVASLITQFAEEIPPYFFAEPGDIWIDIRLTTPVRTYVLARKQNLEETSNENGNRSSGEMMPLESLEDGLLESLAVYDLW